jgi:alkylation response protein AidB-like acyl-CoA dehydrogenase
MTQSLPGRAAAIAAKVEAFVRNVVISFEKDPRRDHHGGPTDELVTELKELARTTDDTVVEQIYREIRAFRIYDGPTEVHKWALAKKVKRDWKASVA